MDCLSSVERGEVPHADFVVSTIKRTGALTVPEIVRLTGVRQSDVIRVVLAEDGKRLRQAKRRREVVHVLWEAV